MEPKNLERETRAREGKKFAHEFRKNWPTAAIDDQARLDKAIADVPEADRQAALDGIAPFLAELEAHGRTKTPAGATYLNDRKWTLLPERREPSAETRTIKCWSRDWWGLLLARIAAGAPTGFMLDHASTGAAREVTARLSELPPDVALEAMHSLPSDGEAVTAWRVWFAAHGVHLPQWRERVWLWLPARAPPAGNDAFRAGDDAQGDGDGHGGAGQAGDHPRARGAAS